MFRSETWRVFPRTRLSALIDPRQLYPTVYALNNDDHGGRISSPVCRGPGGSRICLQSCHCCKIPLSLKSEELDTNRT
jgi:hypothetical protein